LLDNGALLANRHVNTEVIKAFFDIHDLGSNDVQMYPAYVDESRNRKLYIRQTDGEWMVVYNSGDRYRKPRM